MEIKEIHISAPNWEKIKTFISGSKNDIALILCHWFTWNSSTWLTNPLWELLSEEFLSIRFDFRGNWESEGKFQDTCISRELEDLTIVIDYIKKNYYPTKIILIWHSFWWAIALLNTQINQVGWLILISWEWNLEKAVELEFDSNQLRELEEKWSTQIVDWSKDWELNTIWKKFLEDMQRYSTLQTAKNLQIPCLIIHWKEDEVIPVEFSQEIYNNIKGSKEIVLIERADHSFNIYNWNNIKLVELSKIIRKWLNSKFSTQASAS